MSGTIHGERKECTGTWPVMCILLHMMSYTFRRNREKLIASNGVVQVEPERAFRILIAHLSKKPKLLAQGQIL